MLYYDRYIGKMTKELPSRMDLGRFAVVEGEKIKDLTNLEVTSLGDYIIRESIFEETNQNIHDLLRTIASIFDNDFINVMPIIQKFNIEFKEFEKELNMHKHHLEAIVAKPHSLLEKSTMKVNIGRAKRISTRSYQYLAHHSEDWEKMTVLSPKPRRILHEELIINYVVYENLLLKAFLHEAIKHLNKRIKETADITKFFLSIFDQKEFLNVWPEKINRSHALVGKARKKDQSADSNRTNSHLSNLKSKLLKLEHSPLFEEFPKRLTNNIVFHDTNVLNSHKHYKYLKILWLELKKNKENVEDKEPDVMQQEIMDNMRIYVESLFVYSLKNMGYFISKENGNIKAIHNDLPPFEMKSDKYGVLHVRTSNSKVSVVTLGGAYNISDVKLPKDTICFCFKDFQDTKEIVNENIYFVNPIDTNSIECSGKVLRKLILKEYLATINKKVDFKHSLRDFTTAIVCNDIVFDKKAFKFSFSDRIPDELDVKAIISNLKEMPAFIKQRNKRDKDSLISDMEQLVSDINSYRSLIKKTLVCPKCFKHYRSRDIKYLVCDCGFICDLTNDNVKFSHQLKNDQFSNITSKGWGMDLIE